jgi:preprotein translocase subunit SecG
MTTVVIVIHLMVVVAMIGLILLQRSEGGALGIGGGQGAFMTGRSAGNVLSHTTAYLALAFFLTSLGLAFIAKYESRPADILERLPGQTAPLTETPAAPAPTGAPTSAEDLLKQLGGTSGGPQTPPATDGAAVPPAANGGATPAPATQTPTETQPPAAQETAPPAAETAPAPQTPPAQ